MSKPTDQSFDEWLRGQFKDQQLDADESGKNIVRQVRKRVLIRRWLIIAALIAGGLLTGVAAFQLLTESQITSLNLMNLGTDFSAELAGSLTMSVIIAFGFGFVLMFED